MKTHDFLENFKILILMGISCAGKDTLKNILMKEYGYQIPIQVTTRKPRDEEEKRKGLYEFMFQDEFQKCIKNGEFAEWVNYAGDFYAIRKHSLMNMKGKICIILEGNGANQIKTLFPKNTFCVLIHPVNIPFAMKRAIERGDNDESISKRFNPDLIKKEISEMYLMADLNIVSLNGGINQLAKKIDIYMEGLFNGKKED